mmetsp:Transcript_14710/g.30335  ORF Transcript_14710/g.30335 Transcript_14710/m.30335 type:complete len:180 (-) Transcript_14710:209-748(-)
MMISRTFQSNTFLVLCLAALASISSTCVAFSIAGQRCSAVGQASSSSLFRPQHKTALPKLQPASTNDFCWSRRMADVPSPEAEEGKEPPPEPSAVSTTEETPSNSDEMKEGGMWKTALLAGPLFLKFVVVLVIKLATDLIVFPLLWTYRLARLTKNSLLKMIGRGPGPEYPNGAGPSDS